MFHVIGRSNAADFKARLRLYRMTFMLTEHKYKESKARLLKSDATNWLGALPLAQGLRRPNTAGYDHGIYMQLQAIHNRLGNLDDGVNSADQNPAS